MREPVESPRTLLHVSPPRETAAEEHPRRRIARTGPHPSRGRLPGMEDVVLGRYRLLDRLGAGGFGEVWHAHDELLRREVAVKRIWLGPELDSERATREALAAARLCHPAIVALYEACTVDDAFYLISELVDGETLARLIATAALHDEEVLEIGVALAGALCHAHARGVIHRDIKPQNVLVPHRREEAEGAAKLTDFGGASLTGEDALTRTGDVLGTLAYMAPEQSEGHEVDVEADLYSLALVLYESFSGVNPVRGDTPAATARRIGRQLTPLERRRPDLPRELTRVLDVALSPAPSSRGSVDELRLVLCQTLERGLRAPRWRRRAPAAPTRLAPVVPVPEPRPASARAEAIAGHEAPVPADGGRIALPRAVWLGCALALIGWQAFAGRPGVALLALAALLPLLALPGESGSSRLGAGWLGALLAPALGLVGLAGAFPALAGQLSRWRERAVLGALGYWWLTLAEPLLSRRLWLGEPAGTPARESWEGSIGAAATHVVLPMFTLGVLFGALLWACGSLVLPWIVRGRRVVLDLLAAVVWSVALAVAAPALDGGLVVHATQPAPRGIAVGAIFAGALVVAARALRGPV
jgi:eukaryotic-like serine/threonine-protein kinase